MKRLALALAFAVAFPAAFAAQPTGKQIIGDVSRIVAPAGVQENFKLHINGIDQWVYTRGQDRKNPVLLFVHGGPASTSAPTMWIPVVMFMGRHDYTTPSEPTAAWLGKVKAPYKRAVWFENSSHLVQFEEPGKTLVSLLEYVRPLAKD